MCQTWAAFRGGDDWFLEPGTQSLAIETSVDFTSATTDDFAHFAAEWIGF
jgi:hypothetical protein